MSKMSELSAEVEAAKGILRSAGIPILDDAPETPDEKLDRLYQDFAEYAARILALIDKGAHLPAREHAWVMKMNTARIVSAARKAEESVR